MATTGQVITNKRSTDTIIFTKTRADTNGALLQFENYHQPHGIGPVPHRHPLQTETFTVVTGTLAITINDHEQILTAGQTAVVPPNAVHCWHNAGTDILHVRTEFRPALHFEEIIETIACLSQLDKMDAAGNPDPLQMSATLNAYYGEFFLATMPLMVQRFLFGVFGKVLRTLLGFPDELRFAELPPGVGSEAQA